LAEAVWAWDEAAVAAVIPAWNAAAVIPVWNAAAAVASGSNAAAVATAAWASHWAGLAPPRSW